MKNLLSLFFLSLCISATAQTAHLDDHEHGRAIEFPDVPGFVTLSVDFHQHTVFSDGSVWPDIRVQEAVKDGIDAISLTEHLEYQPHEADLPNPDRNRSYIIAEQQARPYELLVIRGAEITRDMPPGHNNAVFIEDANKLLIQDSVEVFREAKRQGAFVFWDHPNWIAQRGDGIATVTETHDMLFKENLIQGIEVVNDLTYSDEALQIALDYDLAIIGTSDIHGLVDWQFNIPEGGHRPVTLVLAKERSPEAIKEALFARRTIAWFNNLLIGRDSVLSPLLESCMKVVKAEYQGPSAVIDVVIENLSDAEFLLANTSDFTFHANGDFVTIHPNSKTTLQVKTLEQLKEFDLTFKVMNALTAPKEHPDLKIKVDVQY